MSALKTWALVVLSWGAMGTLAHADSIAIAWDWTAWVQSGVIQRSASTSTSSSSAGTPPSGTPADAYLNFGTSPNPEQSLLTTGTAAPWYTSPAVSKAYGGSTPTLAQQQDFISSVANDVQQTFTQSGLTGANAVSITTDPNAAARHTLSIASGLSYAANPNAIGITDVGANGFGFIDKLAYASTPQDLEWAVAHNISHELMHAFGVAVHHDQTGQYLDAATANWSLLTNPSATLSSAAVSDIIANNVGRNAVASSSVGGEILVDGDQEILAPVPEPSTIALWGLAATALLYHHRRRTSRRLAA